MSASRQRHPIRAFFGGLFVGLGVAMLLVLYGKIAFGTLTPYVIILAGVVLGVAWAYVAPVRGGGGRSDLAPPPPPELEADADPEAVPETAAAPPPAPEPEPEPPPEPLAAAAADATPAAGPFTATHVVPAAGLVTYAGAEEGGGENGRLDPGLEVQVLEQHGDWAKILCSNGWSAWVDARQLLAR